ncbi:MAG: CRISPR-associated protein Cas4 [Thermoplasmata archaeon]
MSDEYFLIDINDVTGVQVAYFIICRTKLWLFSHKIEMEYEHENIRIGRQIHDESFKRERKEAAIGPIKIDFIRKKDILEVHEIKKTNKIKEAHRLQMLYYLYVLKKGGVAAVGIIDYPLINRRETVELDDNNIQKITEALKEIPMIINGPLPIPVRRRICRSCAYEDFCWGDFIEE